MKLGRYPNKSIWFLCLINIALFYLSLTWRVTGNLDRVITESLFYSAIFYLLWQRQNKIKFRSSLAASLIGTILMTIVIIKSLTLFSFEDKLIFLIPLFTATSLSLLASGFSGILQYTRELFLTGILFFPEEVIGMVLEKIVSVTILNAKVATYFLYYFGFNVVSKGNIIILSLSESENYQAIVNYSCSGMPMIILLFKLALALIFLFPFSKKEKIYIPILSVIIGFMLGVIRVCILTLLIPQTESFNYWHGNEGSQIFSNLAIMLFTGITYWWIKKQEFLTTNQ